MNEARRKTRRGANARGALVPTTIAAASLVSLASLLGLGCTRTELTTARCPRALVVARHTVSRAYFGREETSIEVLESDEHGAYATQPPALRFGREQTFTTEYLPASCAAGPKGYFAVSSQIERLAHEAAELRVACDAGRLDPARCAVVDAFVEARRAELDALYPELSSTNRPPSTRVLPFGRALVPLWSAIRGKQSEPVQGAELRDGALAIVDLSREPTQGDVPATDRTHLTLLTAEGTFARTIQLSGAPSAAVAALPSSDALPGAELVVVTPHALSFFDVRGEERGRVQLAEPLQGITTSALPARIRDAAVAPGEETTVLVLVAGRLVRLGLDGKQRGARSIDALEIARVSSDRLLLVQEGAASAEAPVLPLDGRRQRLDAAVQVVAIPAELGATDPPRVVLPAVSAVVGRDDGLDVLVLGADLEDVTRPRALWARFSEKGAQQAVVELTHPELGGWPRRWLRPWPGAKRRVAIAATRAEAQARADTGVDVLEVVAP